MTLRLSDRDWLVFGAAHYLTNSAREPGVAFPTYTPAFDGKDIVPATFP